MTRREVLVDLARASDDFSTAALARSRTASTEGYKLLFSTIQKEKIPFTSLPRAELVSSIEVEAFFSVTSMLFNSTRSPFKRSLCSLTTT